MYTIDTRQQVYLCFHNSTTYNHTLQCVASVVFHTGVNVTFMSADDSLQLVVLGEPVVCSSMLVSNATQFLKLQWLFPNGTAVLQDWRVNVTQQLNSISLSFNSLAAQTGNYLCNYTLNGRQRSKVVSVSGEMENNLMASGKNVNFVVCYYRT